MISFQQTRNQVFLLSDKIHKIIIYSHQNVQLGAPVAVYCVELGNSLTSDGTVTKQIVTQIQGYRGG